MKLKPSYKKNDRVLVTSYAGPNVCVKLIRRYLVSQSQSKLGVDGWDAIITNQKDINKLRKRGVPYRKGEKPKVFVADWQIIKKI
mgnify:CR=1 FL=1